MSPSTAEDFFLWRLERLCNQSLATINWRADDGTTLPWVDRSRPTLQTASMHLLPLLGAVACAFFYSASADDIDDTEKLIAQHVSLSDLHAEMAALNAYVDSKLKPENEKNGVQAAAISYNAEASKGDFIDSNVRENRTAMDFYEGDIVLNQEQLDAIREERLMKQHPSRARRQAWRPRQYPSNIWGANRNIPYYFDRSYRYDRSVVYEAMKFWQANTCVYFQENGQGNSRIRILDQNKCWSMIGRQNAEQVLSLGQGCQYTGIAAHEIGHALGLYHTQARPDRDNYVTINWGNIMNGESYNFDKAANTDNFGVPYELGSNMHYHPFSFSGNRYATINSKDKQYQYSMGGRLPTFYDILLVNRYYNCFEVNCKGVSVNCQNGGVQDVRNCRQCKCPPGYAGVSCENFDNRYRRLTPTAAYKSENVYVDSRSPNSITAVAAEGNYYIEAPAGKRIELKVTNLRVQQSWNDCMVAGVMIYFTNDTRMNGIRFCSQNQVAAYYTSSGNRMFVQTWSNIGVTSMTFTYRFF